MKTSDYMTCEAFTRAIPRIGQPSADLKTHIAPLLHQIESPQFADHSATIAAEIRALVEQDPELSQVYQTERQKLQQEYRDSDRAKGDSAVIAPHSLQKLVQQAIAATRALETSNGSYAQNNLQSHTQDRTQSPLTAAKLDILRILDKRPCTTRDLISFMRVSTPPDQVRVIVQSLWLQGYIDTVSGGLFQKIFPTSREKSHAHSIDPDGSLTLTTKGHFCVHPIFRFGSQRAMFR